MTSSSASSPRADLKSYRLDDDLLLLDESRGRLVALNATAAFVWVGLAEGVGPPQLAAELSEATGIPLARAAADVDALLEQWRDENLLESANEAPFASEPDEALASAPSNLPAPTALRVVRLLDAEVAIVGDEDVAAIVDELLGHAVVENAGESERPQLRIVFHEGEWLVIFAATLIGRCPRREELPSVVYGTMLLLAFETTDCFAVLHAAAVAKGSSCVLMPGESGSGKSTLTAALVARGYDYCTDDLAILTDAPVTVRPVPLLIGVKDGSWASLAPLWSGLGALPVHERNDGKRIKYLSPGARRSDRDRLAIAALVFPRYRPGATAELRPIARSEALVRTTRAGYDVADSLDDSAVRTLVEKFRELPCYDLHFDDLNEAVDVFADLLPR